MKITLDLANEVISTLEESVNRYDNEVVDKTYVANFEEKPKPEPISLDKFIATKEKVIYTTPKNSRDKETAVKLCEVIDEAEFEKAEKERKKEFYHANVVGSYESYCMTHPLRDYMSETPKRKRYAFHNYSDKPIEQLLYEYAFKWSAYAMRKKIEWSNTDSRIIKVYCGILRNDYLENHTETVQDIIQEALATMCEGIKKKVIPEANHKLAQKTRFCEQYVIKSCDIVDIAKTKDLSKSQEVDKPKSESKFNTVVVRTKYVHFADEDDCEEIDFKVNLDNDFAIYKAVCKSVLYWVDHNSADVGGYDKHGRKQIAISDYVENTYGDWKQEREMIRVEGSVEWLKRREEILACIAKAKPAGELRAYTAVLDLLHDGIIDFDNDEPLTKWQIEMIIASLANDEFRSVKTKLVKKKNANKKSDDENISEKAEMETKFTNTLGYSVRKKVDFVSQGHNKFKSVNTAIIEYKDGNKNKIELNLATIKNTLFAYCRACANANTD